MLENLPPLNDEEKRIILQKGTEMPYTGKYYRLFQKGIYADDEISGAVKRLPDPDGRRTEIVCAACDGHLGHVFIGEGFTRKNTRHCVNSISMVFIPEENE